MTRTHVAIAAVIALVAGFFAGRSTAPTKTTERVVTVEKLAEVAAKEKTETRANEQSTAERDATVWRWREVTKPNGEVVRTATRESVRASETKASSAEAKREAEVVYRDREVKVETLKVVEAERASWAIGARAGGRLGAGPAYGGSLEHRIAGGLWGGVYATSQKEFGVIGRWEF